MTTLWIYDVWDLIKENWDSVKLFLTGAPTLRYFYSTPLAESFGLIRQTLYTAIHNTIFFAFEWIRFFYYVLRFVFHFCVLIYPYFKPLFVRSYQRWYELQPNTKLTIVGIICFIGFTIWLRSHVKQRRYLERMNKQRRRYQNAAVYRYQRFVSWIDVKSQMAAAIFPHFVWWTLFITAFYFVNNGWIEGSIDVLFLIFAILYPSIKTYHKLTHRPDKIRYWLQFWLSRGLVIFVIHYCIYFVSYLPRISYFDTSNDSLNSLSFAQLFLSSVCNWAIVWCYFPITHGCETLTFYAIQLLFGDSHYHSNANGIANGRNGGLSQIISLSSLNTIIEKCLDIVKVLPFVPSVIYEILYNAIYQVLITCVFIILAPDTGAYLLGYALAIHSSLRALCEFDRINHKIEKLIDKSKRDSLINQSSQKQSKKGSKLRRRRVPISSAIDDSSDGSHTSDDLASDNLSTVSSSSLFGYFDRFGQMIGLKKSMQTDMLSLEESRKSALERMQFWTQYWLVFTAFEWIFAIFTQNGFDWVPFWYSIRLIGILWLQLPHILPFNCGVLYRYVTMPWRALDLTEYERNRSYSEPVSPQQHFNPPSNRVDRGDTEMKSPTVSEMSGENSLLSDHNSPPHNDINQKKRL